MNRPLEAAFLRLRCGSTNAAQAQPRRFTREHPLQTRFGLYLFDLFFFRRTWFVVSWRQARLDRLHVTSPACISFYQFACVRHVHCILCRRCICVDTPSCTMCDVASGALLLSCVYFRPSIVMSLLAITYLFLVICTRFELLCFNH